MMTEGEILDAVERFASRPDETGRYPTDAECDAYERMLRAGGILRMLRS